MGTCDGIQVVEMGAGSIAASLAGMLLADNGARVIKVEPPEGDRLRRSRPSGFLVWNRGKESLVADLRTPPGQQQTRGLLTDADVVIEAFDVGVAETWHVAYDDLRASNPGLVYCSIKGFGSTGEYATIKGYEGVVASKTGFWTMGDFGVRPGPIFNAGQMASNAAGHFATGGILAALMVRDHTGRGQRLETTLAQGLTAYDYFGTQTWQHTRREGGTGVDFRSMLMTGASRVTLTCPTADGRWINLTHMLPHQCQAMSRVLGLGDTIEDPRYARQPLFDSPEDAAVWEDLVWQAMRTKTYAEWEPILLASPDVAFEVARRSEEALDHAQIRHNGDRIIVEDPDHGVVEQVGPVATFARTPARIDRSAPRLGEHGPSFTRAWIDARGPGPGSPLEGITVLDIGHFFAMPFGTALLASLGARVIKLEPPTGDPMRSSFLLPEVSAAKVMEGKESIALDLAMSTGREIAHRLVARADAVITSFRPGVAERLGLDGDTVCRLNPTALYVDACGYGSSGPYAHRPIYAGVASALAGQVHRHAGYWLDPSLTTSLDITEAQAIILPRLRGPGDGDANGALGAFTTLLLGLFERRRSGRGQLVQTSMIGRNVLAYADDACRYEGKPPVQLADPENYGFHALYRIYDTAGGWVFLAAPHQKEWENLAVSLGMARLLDDPRFASSDDRLAHDEVLSRLLGDILATREATEWEAELVPKGIACVAAFDGTNSAFTCTDPVMRATGLVVEVEHPILGPVLRHGLPIAFSETPGRVAAGAAIGQHTDAILREVGFSDDAIDVLHTAGVVFGEKEQA